jgi:hypothetical protein
MPLETKVNNSILKSQAAIPDLVLIRENTVSLNEFLWIALRQLLQKI